MRSLVAVCVVTCFAWGEDLAAQPTGRAQAVAGPPSLPPPAVARTRSVRFTTREGSWLSFDLSPDRRWIVVDLLGQLWRLPVTGGVATPLTDVVRDSAEFVDPRFAPDGATVLAHGEYRGRVGVFGVDVGTRAVRWVAPDSVRADFGHLALHTPAWRAGTALLTARPASRASNVLVEHDFATGREQEVRVEGVSEPGRDGATYSRDGASVFFNTLRPWDARVTYPGAGRIWRVPTAGGTAEAVSPAALRACGATPATDGRRLAYFVLDSASRAQVWLQTLGDSAAVPLTRDADVTPTRLAWLTRDTLVYVEGGRLWKLDVRSRGRRAIPFEATVTFERQMPELTPVRFAAAGDTVRARTVQGFAPARDGRRVVTVLGTRLWVSDAQAGATAHVVATVPMSAFAPHWSPDGRRIVWFAGAFGDEDLFVTDTVTRRTTRLTALPGAELAPMWSPDGRRVLFRYVGRDSAGRGTSELRVVSVPEGALDSAIHDVAATVSLGAVGSPVDGKPRWSPDGGAVVVLGPAANPAERPASIRFLDGRAPRAVRGLPGGASAVQWVAGDTVVFLDAMRVWAAHLDRASGQLSAPILVSEGPAAGLESSYGGDLLYAGEQGLHLRSADAPAGSVRRLGWPVRYVVPAAPPLLVRNVRVIDGTGAAASAPRDILVERGRITRVAAAGTVRALPEMRVLDAGGRTAMPGLIDLHSHHRTPAQLRGLLWYGVTTLRNVGCDAPSADAVASGDWAGPRVVAASVQVETDWPFSRGACAGTWPESDARQIERAAGLLPDAGGAFVKLHSNSGWAQQMRVIAAAHARGARVTGHCAYPLALVAAGIDSKEHVGWQCTMHDVGSWYDDLIQLYRAADVPVVPTLALFVTSDRQRGARVPVPEDVAALFGELERTQIAQSLNFRSQTAANTLDLGHALDAAARLHRAGVRLGAGTDFERPDGLQYELEALVEASLSPLAAIRAATWDAARIMGAEREIGRVAPGLLGDLVIVDGDPSVDIRSVRRVWQVVQGGRVIDRERLLTP